VVLIETQTDRAVAKYGVSGKGVTIAILDRGIDWRNPDFIKSDGGTRIKWLLDMTGQNWCDGTNPRPTEYSEAQINAALAATGTIDSRDAVGHGTATAGAAAGNGRAFGNGTYRGIAPEADLVIVKLTSDGAPAHDSSRAEAAFQGCVNDALDWLDQKLTQLGQPAVALINSGTQWGPIDGTSAISRRLDQVFGSSRPGRVFVAPAGDEGGVGSHAGGDFAASPSTTVRLMKSSGAVAFLGLWYSGSARAQVSVVFEDGTTVGPVGPGMSLRQSDVVLQQFEPGTEFYPWRSSSGDRAVYVRIDGHQGLGSVRIDGLGQRAGHFDLYASGLDAPVHFVDHLAVGSSQDLAATRSAIVAGAYVAQTSWTDMDGLVRSAASEGAVGELWARSAAGPTRDGRLGVDIAAPGHNEFVSYAPSSYWATVRSNLVRDGGGWYGRFGATSGSAPLLLGAVALLLEVDPTMTAEQVRQIVHGGALSDRFTSATPNTAWGYGKLNVLGSLDALCQNATRPTVRQRCAGRP